MSLAFGLFFVVIGLPFVAFAACVVLADRPNDVIRLSTAGALLLTLAASAAVVDVELVLIAGRSLIMSPIAQLGIQLLALSMLGVALSLARARQELVAHWLPIAWLSTGGLGLSLLVSSLPLSLLVFSSAALIWALGLPPSARRSATAAVMRYVALLALATPMLLLAFRFAEERSSAAMDLERVVLALAVPGFGLILGLIPLHAWTLTLSSGTPRTMLLGVLSLVQTAGFIFLLRTLERYPWITEVAGDPLIMGGALSAVLGGWLALSAKLDDPDDWLVYALVANSGFLLMGLGTQSYAAALGVVLLLFARVLALVLLSLAPRVEGRMRRTAAIVATLVISGTPGLAGFPGLWLILRRIGLGANGTASLALLAGSGLLFAAGVRRWRAPETEWAADEVQPLKAGADVGGHRSVVALIVLLIVLGLAPQLAAPAFEGSLRGLFLPLP